MTVIERVQEVISEAATEFRRQVRRSAERNWSSWPYGDTGTGSESWLLVTLVRVLWRRRHRCYPEVPYAEGGRLDLLSVDAAGREGWAFELKVVGTRRGLQAHKTESVAHDCRRLRKGVLKTTTPVKVRALLVASWNQEWQRRWSSPRSSRRRDEPGWAKLQNALQGFQRIKPVLVCAGCDINDAQDLHLLSAYRVT